MSGDDTRSRANEVRDDGDDGGHDWRFGLDDVGPDGITEDTSTPENEPIEPGSIDPEHAVFVVLGIALVVGVFVFGF